MGFLIIVSIYFIIGAFLGGITYQIFKDDYDEEDISCIVTMTIIFWTFVIPFFLGLTLVKEIKNKKEEK